MTPWTVDSRLLCPWDFPGKNTRVGFHFFLQGIFLTQGSKPHLLHWQADSLPLSYQGSPSLSLTSSKSTILICFYLPRVSSVLINGHYLSSGPSFNYCWSFLVVFFASNISHCSKIYLYEPSLMRSVPWLKTLDSPTTVWKRKWKWSRSVVSHSLRPRGL